VIVDGRLRTPLSARIVSGAAASGTIIVTATRSGRKLAALRRRGVRILTLPGRSGVISLPMLLRRLAAEGVSSVLLEGGAALAAAALRHGVIDRELFLIAPRLIGGDGVPMIGPLGVRTMDQAPTLHVVRTSRLGPDLLVYAVPSARAARLPGG
jgi:diaminohydroxyphosphoribosylaminopyrimidine deaminase/5-amino-6-(5-phosphoribosylamino)uracil reductase